MRSKTLGLFALTLLVSATFAFASEIPTPASEEATLEGPQVAPQQPVASENKTIDITGPLQTVQLGTEEACSATSSTKKSGESCGGVTCGPFQYCCNPSCNICVSYGMSCTQQSCN